MKRYTAEQAQWIKDNANARAWGNLHAFAKAFNEKFNENKTGSGISCYMRKHDIKFSSENRLPEEQKEWIRENAQIIEWKNTKHFTDTFNALFGTNKTENAMNNYLFDNKIQIRSKKTVGSYTDEMNKWLIDNYSKYDCDFVSLANDFNRKFGTDYSNVRIAKHCARNLKIHKPRKKEKQKRSTKPKDELFRNKGQFVAGKPNGKGLPVGTIRYNSDGRPFIKVLENDGKSGTLSGRKGHNYKEPWWMPLQKKIWVDHYGEVPKGYVVISLTGNPNDTDIKNIGIIDKRGTAIMAKQGWWTDNRVITGDGAMWCNLYYTARDNNVVQKGV